MITPGDVLEFRKPAESEYPPPPPSPLPTAQFMGATKHTPSCPVGGVPAEFQFYRVFIQTPPENVSMFAFLYAAIVYTREMTFVCCCTPK